MKLGLRIDLSICTAGGTVEHIAQNLQDESLYRRPTGGSRRSGMKVGLRIDLSICTAGCTVEHIGQNLQDESLYRRLTGGNVRWASRRWKTKSFSRPW